MIEAVSPSEFEQAVGVEDWRVVGDGACAVYRTGSFAAGARFVRAIADVEGVDAAPPDVDLRAASVTIRLITVGPDYYGMSRKDIDLARGISALAREQGHPADASAIQSVLVIPGAPDTASVMPFWHAILGYDRRADTPDEDLVDPRGRGPAFWFEPMKEPRPGGGGSIHVAIWVPYEEAEARVAAALEAGGRVIRDEHAPAWWTLADPAGNEADIATTRSRD